MATRFLGPSGSKRSHTRLFVLAALIGAVFTVFFVGASTANVGASTFGGGDGNLTCNDANGATDWNCLGVATINGVPSGNGLINVGVDDPSGSGDNSFGQGTKEDDPDVTVVSGSIPPQKSDLTRFYEASELVSNHVFIYLAWERTNVLGSANMDFEINQNATSGFSGSTLGKISLVRTNGDILVTFDFGGSGAPVLGILRWLTTSGTNPYDGTPNVAGDCFSANKLPCWGDQKTLNGASPPISEGAVNSATVSDNVPPNNPRNLAGGTFGEASIDLTAAGVINGSGGSGNSCQFGSATTFLKSRSSASFPAEIKDFVAPVSTPLVNNCGAFQINKTSTKGSAALAGAKFSVTKDGAAITGSPFTTDANGHICIPSLASGDYVVRETEAPAGYKIDDTTSHTVTVAGGDTCTGTTAHTIGFTDTPLSTIEVKFTSLAGDGVTTSQISCKDSSNVIVPAVSENGSNADAFPPTLASRDDTDETFGNGAATQVNGVPAHTTLTPGVYTCTIDIDP